MKNNINNEVISQKNMNKKKEIIIHIGMHKTGSSSIQETLHMNMRNNPSFAYVNLGSVNHSKLQFMFTEKGKNYKSLLIDNFISSNSDNMIISGEGLVKLSQNELKKLKKFLSNYFDKIKIVCYIRPPASYMSSAFQQRLKGGGINSFEISNTYPRYKEKFQKFDLVFGKEHVHFWKFNPKEFIKNDVVLDFCYRLNININPKSIIKINESISKEALSLLYVYRKFFPQSKHDPQSSLVVKELSKIGNTPFKFNFYLLENIIKEKQNDITWMERRLSDSLEEENYHYPYEISSEEDILKTAKENINSLVALIKKDFLPKESEHLGKPYEYIISLIQALQRQTSKQLKKRSKKRLCIIHIGMPKTGSSSIQKTLNKQLKDPGTVYIPFANDNHGGVICTLFGGQQHINRFHNDKSVEEINIYKRNARRLLINTINSSDASKFIISGEAIQTLDKYHLIDLKHFMDKLFDNVKIVAYVRPPYSYISSAFQQFLKTHSTDITIERAYPNYKKRFGKFYTVFGSENLHLWKFDPKKFPQNNVVLDFCKKLDIDFANIKTIKKNESLSKEAIKILYSYRKSQVTNSFYNKQKDKLIVYQLQNIGTTKFRFSPLIINPILQKYKEDIEWMERRLGEPLLEKIKETENDIKAIEELLVLDASENKKLKDIIKL